jgi:putative acetyltransferase
MQTEMTDLSLRPANGRSDDPALVAIWRSAVDATHSFLSDADRDEIEKHLASDYFPAVTLTVAELDGRPVGFSGVVDGDLAMLFIEADERGRGIGTALLDHAIEHDGVTTVDVNEQNTSALGFYLHKGFEVIGCSETDEAGRPYPILHMGLVERMGVRGDRQD